MTMNRFSFVRNVNPTRSYKLSFVWEMHVYTCAQWIGSAVIFLGTRSLSSKPRKTQRIYVYLFLVCVMATSIFAMKRLSFYFHKRYVREKIQTDIFLEDEVLPRPVSTLMYALQSVMPLPVRAHHIHTRIQYK